MSIIKRHGSPFWWMSYRVPGSKAPTRKCTKIRIDGGSSDQSRDNKRLAIQWEAKWVTADTRGRLQLEGAAVEVGETFGAFVTGYWTEHLQLTHEGRDREDEMLPRLCAAFGAVPMGAIDQDRVIAYRTHRLKQDTISKTGRNYGKPKPQTVNREIALLKGIIGDAVELKRVLDQTTGQPVKVSPLFGMTNLRPENEATQTALSQDEEDRLLDAIADDVTDYALVLMGIDTLGRQKNLLGFTRRNDKGDWLHLGRTKNGELHKVPCSGRLRAALDAVPVDPADPEHYFAKYRKGERRHWRQRVRTMLKAACNRAGVVYGRAAAGITFHRATRATGATRLSAKNFSLGTIQDMGGWRDARQVSKYVTPEEQTLRRAAEAIGSSSSRAKVVQLVPKTGS